MWIPDLVVRVGVGYRMCLWRCLQNIRLDIHHERLHIKSKDLDLQSQFRSAATKSRCLRGNQPVPIKADNPGLHCREVHGLPDLRSGVSLLQSLRADNAQVTIRFGAGDVQCNLEVLCE